jgi:hypothetical protein
LLYIDCLSTHSSSDDPFLHLHASSLILSCWILGASERKKKEAREANQPICRQSSCVPSLFQSGFVSLCVSPPNLHFC